MCRRTPSEDFGRYFLNPESQGKKLLTTIVFAHCVKTLGSVYDLLTPKKIRPLNEPLSSA